MKRLFGIVVAAMLASSVFAGPLRGLAKSLNSLDMSQSEEISGKLADGRDLLPILCKYAKADDEPVKGVVNFYVNFKNINPTDRVYSFEQAVVFKFGGGLQKQESEITVKQTENGFTVRTTGMRTGNLDKNGKFKGNPTENPMSSWNKNSKNIASDLEKFSKSITNEEYAECLNEAIVSPFALDNVANKSTLVFKKYIKDNEVVGRKISVEICVTKVDEAPKNAGGYAYYVEGKALCGYKKPSDSKPAYPISSSVHFYTNDESVISLTPVDFMEMIRSRGEKIGSLYEVKGTISDVSRLETSGLAFVSIKVNE